MAYTWGSFYRRSINSLKTGWLITACLVAIYAQVFGIHWRPLYQVKFAARAGLEGVADYLASMTSFVFYLPTVLLWLMTILVGAAVGWRILRWAARAFFGWTGSAKQPA